MPLPGPASFPSLDSPVERARLFVDGDTGYGARGAIAEARLLALADGRFQYSPKKGVTFSMTAEHLVRRLVALVPPPRRHLTSFHGVYAPNSRLRSTVTQALAVPEPPPTPAAAKPPKTKRRLDNEVALVSSTHVFCGGLVPARSHRFETHSREISHSIIRGRQPQAGFRWEAAIRLD